MFAHVFLTCHIIFIIFSYHPFFHLLIFKLISSKHFKAKRGKTKPQKYQKKKKTATNSYGSYLWKISLQTRTGHKTNFFSSKKVKNETRKLCCFVFGCVNKLLILISICVWGLQQCLFLFHYDSKFIYISSLFFLFTFSLPWNKIKISKFLLSLSSFWLSSRWCYEKYLNFIFKIFWFLIIEVFKCEQKYSWSFIFDIIYIIYRFSTETPLPLPVAFYFLRILLFSFAIFPTFFLFLPFLFVLFFLFVFSFILFLFPYLCSENKLLSAGIFLLLKR